MNNHGLLHPLTVVTALGCGLIAGVLFAFSSFVMKALGRLHPAHAIAAMQVINIAAISPAFMLALFGTGLACVALAGLAVAHQHESYAVYQLSGSALYLVGVIGVTMAYHVPRNNALARVRPSAIDAPRAWARYRMQWTVANHVRAAAALAAAASLTLALQTV